MPYEDRSGLVQSIGGCEGGPRHRGEDQHYGGRPLQDTIGQDHDIHAPHYPRRQLRPDLLCKCPGHRTQRLQETATKPWWGDAKKGARPRSMSEGPAQVRTVSWWSEEGAWTRGMYSGSCLPRGSLTSREARAQDTGPVHRVWYRK